MAKQPFDALAQARERYLRDQQNREVQDAYDRLSGNDIRKQKEAYAASNTQLLKDALGTLGATRDAIGTTGAASQGVASGDNASAVRGAIDSVATIAATMGPAGEVVGATLKALNFAFDQATKTVDAFVERGKELSKYSPELAVSNATADIRKMFADMREAEELGPALAHLTDAQSQVSAELQELLLPIKQVVVEALSGVLVVIAQDIKALHEFGELAFKKFEEMDEKLGGALTAILKGTSVFTLLLSELIDIARKAKEVDGEESERLFREIMRQVAAAEMGADRRRRADEIDGARKARLNMPIIPR